MTPQKTAGRITLIAPLVYRQQQALPAFRYKTLGSPLQNPPVSGEVDDSAWETIEANTYWGTWATDFIMRTRFTVPAEWNAPVALYLPIGDAQHFSHPEALAYID